jgi:hypothetical protein
VVSFALFLAAGGLYVLVFFFPGRYWRMRRNARSA